MAGVHFVTNLGGIRTTRRTSKTWRPELALSAGPLQLGRTGDGTFGELYGAAWALALTVLGPRLFQVQGDEWQDRTDPDALGELVGLDVRHVALAFDQAARPVLAYERGGVWVRQWDGNGQRYITRGPFPGRDPVLICDALVLRDVPESDVLLYLLDAGRVTLRVQREAYGVARLAADLQDSGAVLDQALAVPAGLQLLGERGDGRPWALASDLYPLRFTDRVAGTGALSGTLVAVLARVEVADTVAGAGALSGSLVNVGAVTSYADDMAGAGALSGALVAVLARVEAADTVAGAGVLSGTLVVVVVRSESSDQVNGAASITGVVE